MRELRLFAHPHTRDRQRLDARPPGTALSPPSVEWLCHGASQRPAHDRWLITGGEPCLRPDLPALIGALLAAGAPSLGLRSDGLALSSERSVALLVEAGLSFVRLPLHSARSDAHDWLVGRQGAARRVRGALRRCRAAGLALQVEATLTRPTSAHLPELVEVVARLGVRELLLRRPQARFSAAEQFVAISPRLGPLQAWFDQASILANRRGIRLRVEGFPRCGRPSTAQRDQVSALVPEGWGSAEAPTQGDCGHCPGPPHCQGAPADYVHRFGWDELCGAANTVDPTLPVEVVPWYEGPAKPPPRAGRLPATRRAHALAQARRPTLGGDPLSAWRPGLVPSELTLHWPASQSSRTLKRSLVRAAQSGASRLRVVGFEHPQVSTLLRDSSLLSVDVEACGALGALAELPDRELRRLRGLQWLALALQTPSAPESWGPSLALLRRLAALQGPLTGAYALMDAVDQLPQFAAAWPPEAGPPALRLATDGGSLSALAAATRAAPTAWQAALVPLLPPCLLPRPAHVAPAPPAGPIWRDGRPDQQIPHPLDRRGTYATCPHASACRLARACPGLALGWDPHGIEAKP